MSKLGKFIGGVALGALAASLIPYRFQKDEETGGFELSALLWGLKKTPGEEQDTYTVELLPCICRSEEPDGELFDDEESFEAPSAEDVAEKVAEAVENAAETAKEAAEEVAEELG